MYSSGVQMAFQSGLQTGKIAGVADGRYRKGVKLDPGNWSGSLVCSWTLDLLQRVVIFGVHRGIW